MRHVILRVSRCSTCSGQRPNEPPYCPDCNGIGTVSIEITLREFFDELGLGIKELHDSDESTG